MSLTRFVVPHCDHAFDSAACMASFAVLQPQPQHHVAAAAAASPPALTPAHTPFTTYVATLVVANYDRAAAGDDEIRLQFAVEHVCHHTIIRDQQQLLRLIYFGTYLRTCVSAPSSRRQRRQACKQETEQSARADVLIAALRKVNPDVPGEKIYTAWRDISPLLREPEDDKFWMELATSGGRLLSHIVLRTLASKACRAAWDGLPLAQRHDVWRRIIKDSSTAKDVDRVCQGTRHSYTRLLVRVLLVAPHSSSCCLLSLHDQL